MKRMRLRDVETREKVRTVSLGGRDNGNEAKGRRV